MERFKVSTKYEYVKSAILEMIIKKDIKGNQLPSEGFLAKKFGVSLATVREALLVLKKEGVISKRHGSGNYIHRSVLNSSMRVDKFVDFIQLLNESNYQVTWDQSESSVLLEKLSMYKDECSLLGMNDGDEIIHYTRLFYANGAPAIYAHNFVPKRFYNIPLEEIKNVERISDYMWIYCGKEIAHALLDFVPIVAGEEEMAVLPVSKGEPMITWKETFFTLDDIPICFSRVVFNPAIMKLRMLWKC